MDPKQLFNELLLIVFTSFNYPIFLSILQSSLLTVISLVGLESQQIMEEVRGME